MYKNVDGWIAQSAERQAKALELLAKLKLEEMRRDAEEKD